MGAGADHEAFHALPSARQIDRSVERLTFERAHETGDLCSRNRGGGLADEVGSPA
jgi:hypothetical protein